MAILFSFVFLRDEIMHNGWNPGWMELPVIQVDHPIAEVPVPANNAAPLPADPVAAQFNNNIPAQPEDQLQANAAVQADLDEEGAAGVDGIEDGDNVGAGT